MLDKEKLILRTEIGAVAEDYASNRNVDLSY